MLVEDNEINQQVAIELLEGAGLIVDLAGNGVEGVHAAKDKIYDLILMDIQMPEMDGFEATQKIRNDSKASSQKSPIIAMTAHAMAGDREKSIKAGMNDHVTKPIDPDQLFDALFKWIEPGERRTAKPKAEEISPKAADELPLEGLPGLNIKTGLTRVAGNRKLYKKLLGKFKESQADAVKEIEKAIENGDTKTAVRLAHTVKGVAGNIGADDLYHISADLEKALSKNDEESRTPLMKKFVEDLNILLGSITIIESRDAPVKEADRAEKTIDINSLAPILTDLSELLDSDLSEAVGRLEDVRTHLEKSRFSAEFKKLEKSIEEFDMDSALETIKGIAETLGITLGKA